MTYYLPHADGSWGSFEDNVPREVAYGKAWRYDNPLPPPPPVDKPYTAFGAGIDRTQALGYSALEGLGRAVGLEGLADWAKGGVESNLAAAEKGLPQAQQQSFSDANNLTDILKATGQAISTTALPTVIGIGGGLIGGSLAAGPAGALPGASVGARLAGALTGGMAATLPSTYGQHRETQKEVSPGQPVNEGAALLAAAPSAAADALVNWATFGIGKATGIPAKAVGATLLPRVAKGIGVGMVSEVPAEVFQEVLDRAQSGQELLSPDAMAAYKESALGAAAVGGVLGGGYAGAFGRRPAAPGTRGEDAGLLRALTEEGATRPPAPPGPTVLVAGGTFDAPGTTTAPLKEYTDWAVLKFPREMTTAVDAELDARRKWSADPDAVLSPEAIRAVQEATAVKIADEKMAAGKAAESAATIDAAQKNLDTILAATNTGSISERMAAFDKVPAAKAALKDAKDAVYNTPEALKDTEAAFRLAARQAGRAGPLNSDLRTAATTEGTPRIVLNPEFDERKKLSGGEFVTGLSEPGPDGEITAFVMRQVEGAALGVTKEVAVNTTESNLYRMPMRAGSGSSDPRATQDLAAKLRTPPPAGVGSDIQPRDATARVGSYPLEDPVKQQADAAAAAEQETARVEAEKKAQEDEAIRSAGRGFADRVTPVVPLTLAERMAANAREEAGKTRAEGDAKIRSAGRGFVDQVTPVVQPTRAQQMAANVADNEVAADYTRTADAARAAERAEAAAQVREQEAQAAQAEQDLADKKTALATARRKNLDAANVVLAANAARRNQAAAFRSAALFPGGIPEGSKQIPMAARLKQNKIYNANKDAAQAEARAAQEEVNAAQKRVAAAREKAANMDALREGVRATTSSAATTPPLTPAQQRAANVAANKTAKEYGRTADAARAAERAEQDRVALAPASAPASAPAPAPTTTADPSPADKAKLARIAAGFSYTVVLKKLNAATVPEAQDYWQKKVTAAEKAYDAALKTETDLSNAAPTPAPTTTAGTSPADMASLARITAEKLYFAAQDNLEDAKMDLAYAVPGEQDAAQEKVTAAQKAHDTAKEEYDAAALRSPPVQRNLDPRGAQASARGSTAAPAAVSTPATAATADPALAARRAKAFEVINDRLQKMRARGAQGAILADNLDAELESGVLTPAELYVAFQASSVMAIELPAGANHDIKFVPRILADEVSPEALDASGGTGGANLAGTRRAPAAGVRGLIKLSLEPQFADFMQETAAHEAFHVVQDYLASYDQSAARQIKRDFHDGMSLANVEGTLRRKLELARAPTGGSYWSTLQKSFGAKTFSSEEMQAYIFGALADANRRGVPMTGIKPPYTRLVLALRQFFQRLGGALRGDGFTNTADMLNLLGEGSARRFDAEASPAGTGKVQASARAGLSPLHASAVGKVVGYQNVAPRDGIAARMGRTISGAGLTSIYGNGEQYEKFWDAIIRNASNIAQPFYVLQNRLNREGKFIGGPDVGRAIEQATMADTPLAHLVTEGQLKYNRVTRDFTPVANTKGLEQILTPVGSAQDAQDMFQTYAVALRERDQRAAGNDPFFTNLSDEEIATTIRESESAHPEWKAVAADLQTFNDSLMDLLVDSGLLPREQADKLKSMFYTPFFRMMEEDAQNVPGQAIGTKMTSAINNPQAFRDKLEGGSGAVEPLYSSLTKNASGILRAASKNIAMNAATDAMLAGDLAQEKKKASANPGDRTISFYRDGTQVHYFVSDPVLWASIASAPAPIRNNMAVFAATIARFTREMITSSPSFLLANLWKGKHVAYVQEGSPFLGNTLRALTEAYKNSDAAKAFKISTGFGAEMYGASSADYGKLLARRIRIADGTSDSGDKIAAAWGYVQKVSTATELAERLLLREHLMAQGKTAKDAAWQAYLMAPFARGGAGGGLVGGVLVGMMPYIPFLNAKVQGLTRLGQIAADSGGGQKALGVLTSRAITAVAMRGAMLGVFSMAAAMLAQSEEPKKWERETIERRTNNDIFYIGGKTIYLPRAFEVGFVFGAVPVMIFDALRKGSTEGLAKAFGMGMLNTFGFTALPVPAVIAPLASTVTNFDFLRFAPLTNANLQAKAPEDRFTPTTSGIAKLIGSLPGAGAVGLTPINAQVLLEGYLGTTGIMAINFLSDFGGMVGSSVERPSGPFGSPESIPGLAATLAGFNRFVKTDTQKADKFVTDFYEISRELQQVVRTIHDAQKIGDTARVRQVYEDSRPLLGAKAAITHTADQMSELSSRITQVRQDTRLTTQQKDDLLYSLMSARTNMAQRAVTALREAGL